MAQKTATDETIEELTDELDDELGELYRSLTQVAGTLEDARDMIGDSVEESDIEGALARIEEADDYHLRLTRCTRTIEGKLDEIEMLEGRR